MPKALNALTLKHYVVLYRFGFVCMGWYAIR